MAKTMKMGSREGGVSVARAPVKTLGVWTREDLIKMSMKELRDIAPEGVKDTSKHELINEMLDWQANNQPPINTENTDKNK